MNTFQEYALAMDRIATLRAEAAHDRLVRACLGTKPTRRLRLRSWISWARTPVPAPAAK